MITQIFPTNILIKDLDFSEEDSDDLKATVQALFANFVVDADQPQDVVADNNIPLFTGPNLINFPILREIRRLFVEGFLELAQSYPNNKLEMGDIDRLIRNDTGKLPMLKRGGYKSLHNHVASAAFGILYLDDVDNEKDGGELILRDPAMHSNVGFSAPQHYPIATKKNRLIISPAYVWHEVTPYTSDEDRVVIVLNLDVIPKALQEILVAEHDG